MGAVTNTAPATYSDSALVLGRDYTDGFKFVPAEKIGCDSTNMVLTRTAAGDWCLQRTAGGAETYNFRICLNQEIMGRLGQTYSKMSGGPRTTSKGVKPTSFALVYTITTAALTTHTVTGLNQVLYAANTANAVTAFGGSLTGSLSTATQAGGPYISTVTVGTPAYINTDLTSVSFEWQAVMQNTGVLKVHGIGVYFTYNFN